MASDVGNIISASQRARLLAIQKTARQLDGVSARLATGQKVSSALDNPGSFFLARSLRSKAGDLNRLLDGIGQNIRAIEEADHGIEAGLEILDLAESYIEDLIQKYRAGLEGTGTGLAPNETMVTFNSAADLTTYVTGQDAGGAVTVTGNNQVGFSGGSPWKRKAFNYNITAQTVMTFEFRSTAINEVSTIGFDNDTNFGNDNRRFWIYGTQTSGITYAAPYTTYEYGGGGGWETIEIPVGTYFTGNFNYINFVSDDDVAPFGNSAYRNIILREGPKQEPAVDLSQFREGYADLLNQLDLLVRDTHYRGIHLLKDEKMTTFFNEDRTSKLVTQGIDATWAGLGLNRDDFTSIEAVEAKLSQIRIAKATLRSFGRTLATDLAVIQARRDFTEGSINIHKAGADDLTNADLNEEGANMLALQTLQQLQMNSLALGQTNILSLFA